MLDGRDAKEKIGSHVFSAILPTRTIDASLGLLADVLAAVLASDLSLDDVVAGNPAIELGDQEQRNGNQQEPDDFINERAVGPDGSTIIERLLDSVVAFGFVTIVVRSGSHD